jgi:hypothetical protein
MVVARRTGAPFESIAENRWVRENCASAYSADEKLSSGTFLLAPGVIDGRSLANTP